MNTDTNNRPGPARLEQRFGSLCKSTVPEDDVPPTPKEIEELALAYAERTNDEHARIVVVTAYREALPLAEVDVDVRAKLYGYAGAAHDFCTAFLSSLSLEQSLEVHKLFDFIKRAAYDERSVEASALEVLLADNVGTGAHCLAEAPTTNDLMRERIADELRDRLDRRPAAVVSPAPALTAATRAPRDHVREIENALAEMGKADNVGWRLALLKHWLRALIVSDVYGTCRAGLYGLLALAWDVVHDSNQHEPDLRLMREIGAHLEHLEDTREDGDCAAIWVAMEGNFMKAAAAFVGAPSTNEHMVEYVADSLADDVKRGVRGYQR